MTTKTSRSISYHGSGITRPTGFSPWTPYEINLYNDGTIQTKSNPGYRHPGLGDFGSAFFLEKHTFQAQPMDVFTGLDRGPILVGAIGPGVPTVPDVSALTTGALNALGTTAIARTTPDTTKANVLNFAIETYHDGIPALLGSTALRERARVLRGAGGEYLNVEFGWKPFVSDIKRIANSVIHGTNLVDNYVKHSATKIRRRYYNNTDTSAREEKGTAFFTNAQTYMLGAGTLYSSRKVRSWFSGAYVYYVPVGPSVYDNIKSGEQKANYLLGTRLTPEVIWQSAPWTWAADWFTNVGDIMHNISSLGTDGLMLQYGYMMAEGIYDQVAEGRNFLGSSTVRYTHTIKQRVPATPWGFGFNLNLLSDTQIAIAAAIGVTRGGIPWNMRS